MASCWTLAVSATAHAQLPIDMRGERIVEVEIAGATALVTPAREVGIPIGAPVSRRLIRSALKRLAATGRWADAQIDLVRVARGVRVVAHLVPRVLLTRMDIRGNHVLSDSTLRRDLDLGSGSELRAETPGAVVETVRSAYRERGYEQTQVGVVLRDTDDPTRKVLLLQVDEGEPTRITRVHFQGDAPPPDSRASSALGFDMGDVLDRRRLVEGVHAAEAQMRERGYLEAELGDPVVLRTPGGVIVNIPSSPGPRYRVVIRGAWPLEHGDVEEVLNTESERLTNAVVQSIEERVVDLYRRHGFHDATAEVSRSADTDPGAARLLVSVRPGAQLDVVAVTFPGTRHFDLDFLRDQLHSYLQDALPGSEICADSPWSRCRTSSPVDTDVADMVVASGDRGFRRDVRRPLVVDPQRIYYEPTYDEASRHIQQLLRSAGFLSARVGPARMRRIDAGRAVVEVPVVEGPRTMLHRVELRGNETLSEREILEATDLRRGMPFSHLALEQARLRITELYQEAGHLYARVTPRVRFSGDRTRADVGIEIVEGFEVRVGRVMVRGANQTSESLILEQITLRSGDVYRPSEARESQERLLELGIFSAVNVSPQDADLPARIKPVIVTVAERKWGFLDLAGGFSTGEGLRAGFDFGIRNVFGYAVGINVGIRGAFQFFFVDEVARRRFQRLSLGERMEGRFTIGATIPHTPIPNVRLSLDAGFFQDNERDFGINRFGGGATLNWRPTRRMSVSPYFTLERNDVHLFVGNELADYLRNNMDPRLERLLRVPEGSSFIWSAGGNVSLDLRDNPFLPTRGLFATLEGEYARTISTERQAGVSDPFESNFVKLHLTTNGYVPIAGKVVFATQLQLGRVYHLSSVSKTYPNRSFFLGGVDTMRGYLQDAMIPQDVADQITASRQSTARCFEDMRAAGVPEGDISCSGALNPNGVFRGGDAFVLLRGELRFNIPVARWLYGGVFAELGNLWADARRLDPLDLRPVAGGGLRVETPVGPIALDVGFLLARRRELSEDPWALHFSIGLF